VIPASNSLLDYKSSVFSQNGEDGVIKRLFEVIGVTNRTCCEFGAWDGIVFSNTRQLILQGWSCLMIEGDEEKFRQLKKTYAQTPRVTCVQRYVDTGANSLAAICAECGFPTEMDFLSIDIDGMDYEIFRTIKCRPRVVCVEVSACHPPEQQTTIPDEIAAGNVGQPLGVFTRAAREMGYALAVYTANAFYVRADVLKAAGLHEVSDVEAYEDYLAHLPMTEKEHLLLANRSLVIPYRHFQNPRLSAKSLGIPLSRAARLILPRWIRRHSPPGTIRGFAVRCVDSARYRLGRLWRRPGRTP
jgi:hypothetical protein